MDKRFTIQETNDETRTLVDSRTGEHLLTVTHERFGWDGMDILNDFEEILNRFVQST